jgi:uncharacterized protein (TIGR03000 family)
MRFLLLCAFFGVSVPGSSAEELTAAPAEGRAATVRVTLPAHATLTIDGQAAQSKSAQRLFVTPPLQAGKLYSYTLSARFLRAGKTITLEQEVLVRAGRETLVSMDVPAEASAGSSSRGGNGYLYGAGGETRTYYEAPEPPAPPRAGLYFAPSPGRSERGPREGRSYSPSFHPIHWGTDPSDPFYHGQQ